MARKKQRTRKAIAGGPPREVRQIGELMVLITIGASQKRWPEVVEYAQKLLTFSSLSSHDRIHTLWTLAVAYAGLEKYDEAYWVFTQALSVDPQNAVVLAGRGITANDTGRSGQGVRDLEMAATLLERDASNKELARKVQKELKRRSKAVLKFVRRHGADFTLDQLIELQEIHLTIMKLMDERKWVEAEELLRRVITIPEKDFDPRPWNNLGICLMRQQRYDEAEDVLIHALKINRFYFVARSNLRTLMARKRGVTDQSLERYVEMYEDNKLRRKIVMHDDK